MNLSKRGAVGARVVLWMALGAALPGSQAWAADPSYSALLDSARAAILRGSYGAARELLDKAELASTSSPTVLSTEDVARLPFYRGAVEWYAGNRDEASLRQWRAAAVVSADLQPDPQLLPDSQARDVYYALRGEVRSGEQAELKLPDDASVFVDGRRPEPSDAVPAGRHLVQVRCPAGNVASSWHTYGAAPTDYFALCSGVAYTGSAATTAGGDPTAEDALNAVCPLMTPSELDATVARGREALFAEDIATVVAVDAELQKRLPCFRGALVEPEHWAPHLVTLSIAAYARNLDWQTPLASALASLPTVSRAVGAGHPVGAWVAPAPVAATRTAPAGVEVYVDGRRVSYLPPLVGPHLVQLRDGKQFLTRYLVNGEADAPWEELLAPFVPDVPVASTATTTQKAGKRGSPLKLGFVVGGAVLAAGGGGLLALASTEEQTLLADEQQLRQWSLAGETAESVESDPAVQQVNTLYIAGFAVAGAGLALGVLGFAIPLPVVTMDGTPALVYSGAF